MENELSKTIVNTAFQIHYNLGPGLLESVYEEIMYHELRKLGLTIERQKGIPVIWNELKSVDIIAPVHPKQLLTYLKLTNIKLGLLINFNEPLIKNGITRIVNNL